MSTVQDEAEIGPAKSTNDQAEGELGGDGNATTVGAPEKSDEEEDENSVIATSTTFRGYQGQNLDPQDDSNLASVPTLERPSSADGSLSIPDDTPSVQVGHRRPGSQSGH